MNSWNICCKIKNQEATDDVLKLYLVKFILEKGCRIIFGNIHEDILKKVTNVLKEKGTIAYKAGK